MLSLSDIAAEIKNARKARRLTQVQLAHKARVSRARIAALETEKLPEMGFKTIQRLLRALDLDLRIVPLDQRRPTLDDLIAEENA